MQNLKTRAIFREYDRSESGTIYLKDNLFLFNRTETAQRRNTYTNRLRQKNPSKPFLVIYPEVMKDIVCSFPRHAADRENCKTQVIRYYASPYCS